MRIHTEIYTKHNLQVALLKAFCLRGRSRSTLSPLVSQETPGCRLCSSASLRHALDQLGRGTKNFRGEYIVRLAHFHKTREDKWRIRPGKSFPFLRPLRLMKQINTSEERKRGRRRGFKPGSIAIYRHAGNHRLMPPGDRFRKHDLKFYKNISIKCLHIYTHKIK